MCGRYHILPPHNSKDLLSEQLLCLGVDGKIVQAPQQCVRSLILGGGGGGGVVKELKLNCKMNVTIVSISLKKRKIIDGQLQVKWKQLTDQ